MTIVIMITVLAKKIAIIFVRTTIIIAVLIKKITIIFCKDCEHGHSPNKNSEIRHFCEHCDYNCSLLYQHSVFSKRFTFFEAIIARAFKSFTAEERFSA